MAGRIPILFHIFIVLSLASFAGCTRPYADPKIEFVQPPGAQMPIKGLLDQAASGPLKVIWVHGICPHTLEWVNKRVALVRAALGPGTAVAEGAPVAIYVPNWSEQLPAAYVVKRTFTTADAKTLATYFILWSPIDDPLRLPERYDPTYQRASLNRGIQKFLDQCLVDAVAYTGVNGPVIRDAVQRAIAYALDQRDTPRPPQPVAYVSESLGSKVLFDVVNESGDPDFLEKFSQFEYFYMLANQIPIMNTGEARFSAAAFRTAAPSDLTAFVQKIRSGRVLSQRAEPPLMIIAFSDPNDILSYPLAALPVTVGLANIYVSNDATLLGFMERPDIAHCGYGSNQAVINIVATGNPRKGTTVPAEVLAAACE
jgi:hypothetical protein